MIYSENSTTLGSVLSILLPENSVQPGSSEQSYTPAFSESSGSMLDIADANSDV